MKLIKVNFEGDILTVIDRADGDDVSLKDDPPFSASGYQRLDVSRTMTAIGELAKRVGPVDSVYECFGGVGWHSRYIRQHCSPRIHFATDISKDCIDSIRASEPLRGMYSRVQDAWEMDPKRKFDWVHVDAQSFTLSRLANNSSVFGGRKWGPLLQRAFEASKRYVSVTDSAPFGVIRFAKNRESYAKQFGMDQDNWLDYWRVLREYFKETYGVTAVYVVWWAGQAGCVLFDKEADDDAPLEVVHCQSKANIKLISTEVVEDE